MKGEAIKKGGFALPQPGGPGSRLTMEALRKAIEIIRGTKHER